MKKLLLVVAFCLPVVATQLPTGTISGQVFSREGSPAVGVRVSAMAVPEAGAQGSTATGLVGISMTDSTGRYRLENIPPGRYYVVAGLVDLPTYYPGLSSANGATALNVLSGTPITGINFTMAVSAGVTVSGRVVYPNGSPAMGVLSVGLIGQSTPVPNSAVRSDGSFEILRVRPGNYQLTLAGVPLSQPTPLVIADKDVTGIEVQVLPSVPLTGSINVEGNGLRPRLTIIFSPFKGTGNVQSASAQPNNGSFRAILPEGDYRIGWTNLPAGYELKSITAGSIDLLSATLKVSTSAPPPPIVVNLGVGEKPPWVKVGGKVTGLPAVQNGTPYRLSLSGSALGDLADALINPDGSFEFARLLPGSYSARITPPLPVAPASFTVVNRDLSDVNIAIPPLKEIRGVVSGVTASRAIRLTWTDPVNGSTATSTTAIQPDGTFSFLVPEGERRVTLPVPGYTVQSFTYGSVDLLKDPLRVSLSDAAEFRVTVVPGGPAAGVVGGVLGGVAGGLVTTFSTLSAPPPPPPPPAAPAGASPAVTRVGGDVAQANLISSAAPVYPEAARNAQVQGVVLLQAQISKDGVVEDLRVISGHALLNDAAIQAVRQWRYRPQMMNGQPIPVVTTITVNFALR